MKTKKAVGRSRRMKRESDVRTAVEADLEKGMVTIATVTNPSTRQNLMREKGAERGTEAGAQRNPKIKKNPSTDEQRGGGRSGAGLLRPDLGAQTHSVPASAAGSGFHINVVAFQVTLTVWGSGREGGVLYILFYTNFIVIHTW